MLGFRGHASLFLLLGLLVPGSSQDSVSPGGEPFSLKQLCEQQANLTPNSSCSDTAVNCTCPVGWLHTRDKCYHFSNDKMGWLKSRDSCTEMGSHLAILHTKEQHDALEKEARRTGDGWGYYWIGLSDREVEGDWRWVDNTALQNNKFWNTVGRNAEPDNHKTGEDEGENCAVVDSYTQTWYDVPCSFMYLHICQMEAIPTQTYCT